MFRASYRGHRRPPAIASRTVWRYDHLARSFRAVEDLLAQRGIVVTYETIRRWCEMFGPDHAPKLKRGHGRLGDPWDLDEVIVTIRGRMPRNGPTNAQFEETKSKVSNGSNPFGHSTGLRAAKAQAGRNSRYESRVRYNYSYAAWESPLRAMQEELENREPSDEIVTDQRRDRGEPLSADV